MANVNKGVRGIAGAGAGFVPTVVADRSSLPREFVRVYPNVEGYFSSPYYGWLSRLVEASTRYRERESPEVGYEANRKPGSTAQIYGPVVKSENKKVTPQLHRADTKRWEQSAVLRGHERECCRPQNSGLVSRFLISDDQIDLCRPLSTFWLEQWN